MSTGQCVFVNVDDISGFQKFNSPPILIRPRGGAQRRSGAQEDRALGLEDVRVLREEAVGMYEVAVLEAGSPRALARWMTEHGYRYPEGMDKACNDYVEDGWCFVAVKTRVGRKQAVAPRPGMREADPALPDGMGFDGFVQAMGFRFESEEFVVPMRLSSFNEGELHNIVYILSEEPVRIEQISEGRVVRQLSGEELLRHVTDLLPVRILGGTASDVSEELWKRYESERDPVPHSGRARDLFASDLLAAREGRLAHPFEEAEKVLLRIGERLNLRGPQIDALHRQVLAEEKRVLLEGALSGLSEMTLTVVDGDFPREIVARENLTFRSYVMASGLNLPSVYDAKVLGPAPAVAGKRYEGDRPTGWVDSFWVALMVVVAAWIGARVYFGRRHARRRSG